MKKRWLVEQRGNAGDSLPSKNRPSLHSVRRRRRLHKERQAYRVVLLIACWALVWAGLESISSAQQASFQIASVKPSVQSIGGAITIDVNNVPADINTANVKVTIGGAPADIFGAVIARKNRATIIALVPSTLNSTNLQPVIEVSIGGYPMRYSGPFSIEMPDPSIAGIKPDAQQKGYPISIEVKDLPAEIEGLLVTIGGVTAAVEPLSLSEPSHAFITAIVPRSLSDSDLYPKIEVSFQSNSRNYALHYEGVFAIRQETSPIDGGKSGSDLTALVWKVAGIAGAAVFLIFVIAYFRRWKRRLIDSGPPGSPAVGSGPPGSQPVASGPPHSAPVDGLASIDVPDPPLALLNALRGGRCVAVIGPGMSAEAGLSTSSALLKTIIDEELDPALATQFLKLLESGAPDVVIDALNAVLPPGLLARKIVQSILKEKPRSTSSYSRLAELPLSAVVSMNLDDLAAKAFQKREPPIFVPRDAELCLDTLSRHAFFVFMLNGTTDSPDEVLLSQQNLKDAISRNDAFRDLLSRLYYARPLFFLGMSLSGLQSFLQLIDRTSPPTQQHFALVEVDDSTWQPIARNLETNFGLSVLPFTPDRRDGAIGAFLRKTGSRLDSSVDASESWTGSKIERLELRNIGPFAECNLDFDPGWTVILGDNGVGKSTVLRALAVCIGGRATEATAERLLRGGVSSGSISLKMDGRQYLTTIRRKSGGGVTIDSPSGVPLEREVALAVGFSALRTVGWHRGKATTATPQRPNPTDLISLTSEEPDPRLDGVKQWIVRLDHLKTAEGVSEEERQRYAALYDRVFDMFGKLASGVELKPGGVNPNTGEIKIKTRDGLIAFESLSQGTLSLVGWAGTLMQRLYETAPVGVDPLKSPAIVLVDEIDAHMHPAWQQSLVNRLSEIFENAQFIVTSHSPLVVGGLEPTQVYRFERDASGIVQISRPEYSLKGLGAAGLLTSGLFGLASHLDIETSAALNRKRQLTAKKLDKNKQIGDEELKELDELEKKLEDVDFTGAVRDPLYRRFVDAVSKAEAEAQDSTGSTPIVLTTAEKNEKAELAEKIVRELMSESGQDSSKPEDVVA